MGWTKVEVQTSTGTEQIEVFLPVTRKEALETTYKDYLGGDTEKAPEVITLTSYMLYTTMRDPLSNPSNVTFSVLSPTGAGGILPLLPEAYKILKYHEKPVITITENGSILYGFSPGAYYLMLRNGVEDTPVSQGPYTPTSETGQRPPEMSLGFYRTYRLHPVAVTDHYTGFGMGTPPLSQGYYPLQVIDVLIKVAIDEVMLTPDELTIRQVLYRGALNTMAKAKAPFDPVKLLHNPAPYLSTFVENGLQGEFDLETAKRIADQISEAWAIRKAKLLDMNLYPSVAFIGSPGMATGEDEVNIQRLATALNEAMQKDPITAYKSYLTLAFAIAKPTVLEKLQYLKGQLQLLANTSSRAKEVVTPVLNMIDEVVAFYNSLPVGHDEAVNWKPEDLTSGKYAYDLNFPPMAVPIVIDANVLYVPAYFYATKKSIVIFKGYSSKSWLAEHKNIATITGLSKLVEEDMKGAIEKATKVTETLTKIFNLEGRVAIDTETEYTIRVGGQTVNLKGPKALVIDAGDSYELLSIIPVVNSCPFTNRFRYDFINGNYYVTPLNPNDPAQRFIPENDCGELLLTADQLGQRLGYAVADLGPIYIAGLVIASMIAGAVIYSEFSGMHELTNAYDHYATVLTESLQNINTGIQAENNAITVYGQVGTTLGNVIKDYIDKHPDDPANREIVQKYEDIVSDITGGIQKAQTSIDNGMKSSAEISKEATESWKEYTQQFGKILSILSPENLLKYALVGGAILVGIAVAPTLISSAVSSVNASIRSRR